MKELSPHEKEWFKLIYKIDYETAKQQWEGLETSLLKDCEELACAAAALCEDKIRQAIELARVKASTDSKSFSGFMGQHFYNYTPDEIMQKLSEPQK